MVQLYGKYFPKFPLAEAGFYAKTTHLQRTTEYAAGVAKLVDALDLGSSDFGHGGSSPFARTIHYKEREFLR